MKKYLFVVLALILSGCSLLGFIGEYKIHSMNDNLVVPKEKAVVYSTNDFRGTWGILPLVPIIPYFSMTKDSVELQLFDKKENECPYVMRGPDTLAYHYHQTADNPLCPYADGYAPDVRGSLHECHYIIPKKWLKDSFVVVSPDGFVDTLLVERFSRFVYRPFGIF